MQTTTRTLVLVGPESAGKSTLAAALTSAPARAENLRGSTLSVERLRGRHLDVLDTPGLQVSGDAATTRTTLEMLADDTDLPVVLVVRGTHLDDDLAAILPVVAGRVGVVAVTHWDRVQDTAGSRGAVAALAAAIGVPIVTLDAREPSDAEVAVLHDAVGAEDRFTTGPVLARAGWRVEPPPTWLEHRRVGPLLGLALLVGPAVAAVWGAVTFASFVEPAVESVTDRVVSATAGWPAPWTELVAGDYGLVTMGPLLLVWAMPTIVALALLLGLLKASGLLDRIATAVHPLLRPVGLTGRDLVQVVAGYGCNVPAVLATRSCSSCTRDGAIGAVAYGSACSYQLAATLGVLAAAGRPGLVAPYLGVLLVGALIQARWANGRRASAPSLDLQLLRGRAFLTRPRWGDVQREARTTLAHLSLRALPVFLAIVVVASLLATAGALDVAARTLAPVMGLLGLPGDAALPVVLASIRKDGVLLLAEPGVLAGLSGAQLLAALVLAGALLPCLVTALTILRERGARVAGRLVARQAALALVTTAAIAWLGRAVLT